MELRKDYGTLINLIILFLVIVLITLTIKYYFRPFISMIVLFVLSRPIYDFFNRIGIPNKISAAISILIINIVVILVIFYLGSSIYNSLMKVYNENLNKIEDAISYFSQILKGDNEIGRKVISLLDKDFIKTSAMNTGEIVLSYFIGNICAFFILIDNRKIVNLLYKILPGNIIKKFNNQKNNLKQVFMIEVVLVFISTVLIISGFIILKVQRPIFLGIICGILDVLPYVGTIIVFIPIIIYNIIVKDYLIAFGLILLYLLVQVSREILEAKFLSDKLELHPLLVLLSVYIGVKLFGILGIVVGPMYGILAKEIIYSKD
ncbi:AI-2E family transporter [Clostridium sp. SHJSY1]|uniref:AI-2E family transporter n=1 Tax=Clostridium sp. SHJSY1 TaxID=2942483 RepID=UPI002873FA1B|nr:AI-2E family transporter [Clostridium sp. SHJSY1]MDS0524895.1 AI-2E family transporter [Clostridium sp. SHJSY1]